MGKLLGHRCVIEHFLVVGVGGIEATLKRIPHIVSLFQNNGVACVRATLAADLDKQQLLEVDSAYRQKLKMNQSAKAKAAAAGRAVHNCGVEALKGHCIDASSCASSCTQLVDPLHGFCKNSNELFDEPNDPLPATDTNDAEQMSRTGSGDATHTDASAHLSLHSPHDNNDLRSNVRTNSIIHNW